jgi:hypothetical protein
MDRPVTNCPCLPPPPSVEYSPQFPSPQTGPPFRPTADSPNTKRPPTVDCDMADFLDWDRRSNLVLPSRFGQGIKPPAGRILPRICTPINGAAAPSPVRIGPHPSTTTSIMVLRWGGRGGFALLHP